MRNTTLMRLTTVLASIGLAQTAGAQPSASLVFLHDDPDGIVEPGQTLKITMRLSWSQGYTLGGLVGDAVTTPDAGTAANPVNGFAPAFGFSTALSGVPVLGSIRGYALGVNPGTLTFPPLFASGWSGTDALTFDWTAPGAASAGMYSFSFAFAPTAPTVYLYLGAPTQVLPDPVPTSVIGTSVTVTPSPAALVVLATVAFLPRRRAEQACRSPHSTALPPCPATAVHLVCARRARKNNVQGVPQ